MILVSKVKVTLPNKQTFSRVLMQPVENTDNCNEMHQNMVNAIASESAENTIQDLGWEVKQ